MRHLKTCILLTASVVFLSGCEQNMKFDKTGWQQQGDLNMYVNRNKMLNDLLRNHKLKGLSYDSLIALIGEPNYKGTSTLDYEISIHYDLIDPDDMKNLIFSYGKDSLISGYEIKEWNKHQSVWWKRNL